MKSSFLLSLLALSVLFSCRKATDSPTQSTTNPTYNCTCTINKVSWAANATASIQQGQFIITGTQASDGQTITLTADGTAVGNYNILPGKNSSASYKPDTKSGTELYVTGNPGGGYIQITSIDTKNNTITGSFDFYATRASDNDSKNVLSGAFTNVPFTGTIPVTTSSMTANVGGTPWTASSVYGIVNGSTLDIAATKTDGTAIGFTVPSNITTGTYTFSAFGTYTAQYNANSSTFYQGQSGTLTISNATSHTIAGTFNFNSTNVSNSSDAVSVTNGNFSAVY